MPALWLPSTLLAFVFQALVLSGSAVAAQIWWRRHRRRGLSPLGATVVMALTPCALGYAAFACYSLHPVLGRIFSWGATAGILGTLAHAWFRPPAEDKRPVVLGRVTALMLLAGLFYLSALFIYTQPSFAATAAQRFVPNVPGENEDSRHFAQRLYTGKSLEATDGDKLGHERGPLQTGITLITLPALRALGFGFDKACATAGVWFQLLWIPALWIFLRWLGLTERASQAGATGAIFTGFLFFNSVYVWPKLGGAALVLLGFCVAFADAREIRLGRRGWLLGALAACGALAQSGVLISLLALVVFAVAARRRWRRWAVGAAVFVGLSLPWIAYQHFHEPPGQSPATSESPGQITPDNRGATEALHSPRAQLRELLAGQWHRMFAFIDSADREALRADELFRVVRMPAAWILAIVALPLLGWRLVRERPEWRNRTSRHGLALAWLGLTVAIWSAMMFFPGSTLGQQGTLVVPLLLVGLLISWTLLANRRLFAALAVGQVALFAMTWLPAGAAANSAGPTPFAMAAAAVFGLALIVLGVESLLTPEQAGIAAKKFTGARVWAHDPRARLTLTALAGLALLLFLRKPSALTTPQLWAEDGSIFLVQAEQLGAQAFTTPYMGYLHTLPRIVAWIAPKALGPEWWPLLYNGVAFLIWLLVLTQLFSPRLELPGKPWLALAPLVVPHSGEVMFTITNVQWITALFLLLHPMMAPPRTDGERRNDLAILALLALTGPFAILFTPLYAWRWWRDQHDENRPALLIVAAGAALQLWFIVATGPRFEFQSQPLDVWLNIEVLARRLIIWPVFGREIATVLPAALVGAVGWAFIVVLIAWSLRPHRWQLVRAQIVVALALLVAAAVHRSRPDTWDGDNLVFADRYFYLPRVLLAWLLILEFDSLPHVVARVARTICLAITIVNAPDYITPAPADLQWARHSDAIRRGVPAKIPTLPEPWILEYPGRPQGR